MKVLKRIILAGLALVLVLGMGAYFAIKVAFPPQKVKALIHKHGSEALNRDVTVQEVSIRVFPNLKVAVSEINVANAPGFSADPCIKLRELGLSINFLSLLKFSPVINEIKLVDPEILYEVAQNGHNNLEGLGKADSAKPPPVDTSKVAESPAAVALKSFVIDNGKIRYRELKTGRQIILDRINQQVSLDLDRKLEDVNTKGKLEISEIKVVDPASGLKKGNIRITLRHDIHLDLPAERLQVRSLELGFQDIRALVKGQVRNFQTKPPVLDLSLVAKDIRLASVLKEVPASLSPDIPKLTARGTASLEASVKGALDSGKVPDVLAHFTIRDGSISHKDLPAGVENLNVELAMVKDSLRLARFGFDMGGNPVSMDALITSLQAPVPQLQGMNLNAVLDLGKLVPLLQKLAMVDKEMAATGMVQAKIHGAGPLDPKHPESLKAQGTVDLRDLSVKTKDIPQAIGLNGQIKLDNEKIVPDLKVKTGRSDLALTGSVTNYLALAMPKAAEGNPAKARFTVTSSNLNLDELVPAGNKEEEKEGAPMTAWPALPKQLDAVVDMKLGKTQFMNLAMTNYSSQTKLAGSILDHAAKGTLYSGGFSTAVKADLRDTSDAKMAVKLDVKKVEANDFLSRLNDRLPASNHLMKSLSKADSTIFGKFNLNLDVKTHGLPQAVADNLTGAIDFAIFDGKLMESGLINGLSDALGKVSKSLAFKEFTFSDFKTSMMAEQGKLVLKDSRIGQSVVGAVMAQGTIGFDNTLNLTLEDHLPPGLSQTVAGAAGALTSELSRLTKVPALGNVSLVPKDKDGRAIVYFLVGGTLSRPSFALDAKRMAAEGSGAAKSALTDELNKKKAELNARAQAERAKIDSAARARVEAEKAKLKEKTDAGKEKAKDEAKKKGKDVLKGLGL